VNKTGCDFTCCRFSAGRSTNEQEVRQVARHESPFNIFSAGDHVRDEVLR